MSREVWTLSFGGCRGVEMARTQISWGVRSDGVIGCIVLRNVLISRKEGVELKGDGNLTVDKAGSKYDWDFSTTLRTEISSYTRVFIINKQYLQLSH